MRQFILLMALVLSVSTLSFAASAAKAKKKTYNQAKKECLQTDAKLKGKALQTCIKQKRS